MLDRINKEIMSAMKNKEDFRKGVLKMVKADLQMNVKIGSPLKSEQVVFNYYKKLKKTFEDDKFKENTTFLDQVKKEMDIVEEFIPKFPTPETIEAIVNVSISLQNMGKIIKATREEIEKLGYLFDGKEVSKIVKDKLNSSK